MRKVLALTTLLALLVVWVATRPSPAAPPDEKTAAPDGPRYVIKSGLGIKGLEVGMTRKAAVEFLGFKAIDDNTQSGKYHNDNPTNDDSNLQCSLKDDRVHTITFTFREHEGLPWPFDGITDRGIGRTSTVHDVIRKYGEPDWKRVPRDGGGDRSYRKPVPILKYPELGIRFWFNKHGDLEAIQVFAPEPAPKK